MSLFTHAFDLDRLRVSSDAFEHAIAHDYKLYVALLLRSLYEYEIDALCLLLLVDDRTMQVCSWKASVPDCWSQMRPLHYAQGLSVIATLRQLIRPRHRTSEEQSGRIAVRFRRRIFHLAVWSPHGGEVRLFRDARRPTCAPYHVVYPYIKDLAG